MSDSLRGLVSKVVKMAPPSLVSKFSYRQLGFTEDEQAELNRTVAQLTSNPMVYFFLRKEHGSIESLVSDITSRDFSGNSSKVMMLTEFLAEKSTREAATFAIISGLKHGCSEEQWSLRQDMLSKLSALGVFRRPPDKESYDSLEEFVNYGICGTMYEVCAGYLESHSADVSNGELSLIDCPRCKHQFIT